MPTLETHASFATVKLLYIGDSGAGKTGSLASLAKKYELFILDYDNGLDILTDPKILDPTLRSRIHYETLTDKLQDNGNGQMVSLNPTAAVRGIKLLSNWKTSEGDFGPVSTWGPDRVLVIDSITLQGKALMRYVQHINGKTGQKVSQPMWGDAIDRQEGMLQMLYSDAIKCHVICTAHVRLIDLNEKSGDTDDPNYQPDVHGYPTFLGRQLPQNAGRYFNSVVMAVTRGGGANAKRLIRTRSESFISLKISTPSKVPNELPLETGLLELFEKLTAK